MIRTARTFGLAMGAALALGVIGGLLVATVLTLLVIPSLYLIVDGASRRLTSLMTGSRS